MAKPSRPKYCGLAVVLLALLLSARAFADPAGITISPPVSKLSLGPGLLQAQQQITIHNGTAQALTADLKLVDFKTLGENGGLTLGQVGVPLWNYGLANWMSLPGGNSLTLNPGQTANVEVDIQNRSDLTPGGHYGAVIITAHSAGQSANNSNRVDFSQNLAALLFVKKLGGEQYGLRLDSLSVGHGFDLPQSVNLRFSSTGNVYVIPRGYIEVTDANGTLVEKGIINQDSDLIMQGSSEQLISLLDPTATPKTVGPYKLTAYYRYDGQNSYMTKTITLNIRHIPFAVVVIPIITGVIVILMLYREHRNKLHHKRLRRKQAAVRIKDMFDFS